MNTQASAALTERQQREREYYEEFRKLHPVEEVNLKPILGEERRPWNDYWYVYQVLQDEFRSSEQRALDFGCGPGDSSILLAKIGYNVTGFDISSENVRNAQALAAKYGCADRTDFSIQAAESLNYPDSSFDVVCGIDILHHIEIEQAVMEAQRVLKPGGLAVFKEWVEAPLFDKLRESRLMLHLFPREASLENHITHDERKLNTAEVEFIKGAFREAHLQRFHLMMRLSRLVGNSFSVATGLSKIDQRMMSLFPFTRPYAGSVVFVLRK